MQRLSNKRYPTGGRDGCPYGQPTDLKILNETFSQKCLHNFCNFVKQSNLIYSIFKINNKHIIKVCSYMVLIFTNYFSTNATYIWCIPILKETCQNDRSIKELHLKVNNGHSLLKETMNEIYLNWFLILYLTHETK